MTAVIRQRIAKAINIKARVKRKADIPAINTKKLVYKIIINSLRYSICDVT